MTYTTGYRRPPKSGRFKKGVSGNPKGRPKGSRNFLTLLDQELAQPIIVNENGNKKTITRMQAMFKRMVSGAMQGEHKPLLMLVGILQRTGQTEETDIDSLLPDDYQNILESYVIQRQKSSVMKSSKSTSSTKE
jgi:hypothetical protein